VTVLPIDETFNIVVAPAGGNPSGLVSDDFNNSTLQSWWTFVDPLGDCSLQLTGTGTQDAWAEINVAGGQEHKVFSNGITAPHLLQSMNNTDFEIEVKFESPVTAQYMEQGVFIKEDNDKFLRFDFYSTNANTKIYSEGYDVPNRTNAFVNANIGTNNLAPLYMKIKRFGDQWTYSYSLDGTTWNVAANFTYVINATALGLWAGNEAGTASPAHLAKVDYFFDLSSPIVPEDGANPLLPPVLAPIGNINSTAGTSATQGLSATDADGNDNDIVYSESGLPAFASLVDSGNGKASITINPMAGDEGTYPVTVTVTDGDGLTDDETFDIIVSPAGGNPSGLVSDDFCDGNLSTAWTYVDPQGDGTLSFSGASTSDAWVELSVPGGLEHQLWVNGIQAPHLLQNTNDVDFTVEVKMESPVVAPQYQMQGIVIKQDDYHFLRIEAFSISNNTGILAAILSGGNSFPLPVGSIPINIGVGADNLAPIYLRVDRTGNQWTVDYSFDGSLWQNAGSFTHTMTVNAVGIYGGNGSGSSSPAHTAQFDYFFDVSNPIVPEDNCGPTPCIPTADTTMEMICAGDSLFAEGAWQKTAGIYCDTFTNVDGCDSVVCADITLKPGSFLNPWLIETICSTDSIFLGGAWQNMPGDYYDTLVAANTCDSVVRTKLRILEPGGGASELHINLGGSSESLMTAGGIFFETEISGYRINAFSPGSNLGTPIANTVDDQLYWDRVTSYQNLGGPPLELQFPVSIIDTFEVSIYMAENFFTADGLRVFDLILEKDTVIRDLDVHKEVGTNAALIKTFDVYVDDGALNVIGDASVNSAEIHAISIVSKSRNSCPPLCAPTLDTLPMVLCTGDSVLIGGEYRKTAGIYCDSLTSVGGCDSVVCYNVSVGQSLEITALNLVDAPSGNLITPLSDGYVIVKSALGGFSVDAIPCGSVVQSVVFEVNGTTTRTENVAPFAIKGDNAGAFKNWNPSPGIYILKATPYSGNKASGVAGIAKTVTITVVDAAPTADCNGDVGGTAYLNDCNICVGGNTGKPADFGKDDCGVCNGNNADKDCAGVCFGTAVIDSCGECVLGTTGKPFNGSCNVDCNGDINGTASIDDCGICSGGTTGIVPNADKDTCGVCFGNNLSCAPCQPLEVTQLMLVDADNNTDIAPLTNGYTINKALIGDFSIRADVCDPDSIGSVRFFLNSALEQNENVAPYLINGDQGGIYRKWNVAPGTYTVMAVPYSSSNGTGTAGISLSVVITIVDNAPIVDCNGDVGGSAFLNDCDSCVGGNTGHPLDYGKDDCGVCNGNNADKDCAGVCFGTAVIDSCGDCVLGTTGQPFNGGCNIDCNGDVNGSALIDSCGVCAGGNTGVVPNSAKDTCGVCFGNNLSCAGCAGNEVVALILYDANTNLMVRTLSNNDIIDRGQLADFNIDAEVCTANMVESVEFTLNGNSERTENVEPYAIGGDNGGNFKSWNVANGIYTLVATPYSGNNSTGTMGIAKTITLTITGGSGARTTGDPNGTQDGNQASNQQQALGTTESILPELEVRVYPNPSDGIFQLEISNSPDDAEIVLMDASGRVLNTLKSVSENGQISESLDLQKLPRGVYLLKIIMGDAVKTERLILQ
jgi:hypothetical protein